MILPGYATIVMEEIAVYKVVKKDGKVFVLDTSTDKPIYSSPEDGYIIQAIKSGPLSGAVQVSKVGQLTDEQLLTALANCVKLQ